MTALSIWPRPLVAHSGYALSKPPASIPGLSSGSQLCRSPCLPCTIITNSALNYYCLLLQ